MRERRNSEIERRKQSNLQPQRKPQYKTKKNKQKKKESKAIMIICLVLGIGIGWVTEFDIKGFVENISKYKISIAKKEDEQKVINSELSLNNDNSNKEQGQESNDKKVVSNEVVKSETSNAEQETQQDKINKAKQSIINNCGSEYREVIYAAKGAHPTKGGNYYIFNAGPDGMGDIQFYVDTNTYKVYEYCVDGYFGEYRGGNSNVFTLDMAIRKLENELEWDEDRRFILVEERSDGFIIKTAFQVEGGTGTGETFYVTRDSIEAYTGY